MHPAPPPANLSALSRPELEALLAELFGEVATLKQTIAELREEIAAWDYLGSRFKVVGAAIIEPLDHYVRARIRPA